MTTSNKAMTKQDFINFGGKIWEKNGKERVYIKASIFNKITGDSYSDSNNRFFFDCNENALMRSYKMKSPKIEIQY